MENKIEVFEYPLIGNTIAKIGKHKWLYPEKVNWELPIFFIEVIDKFKWERIINNVIEVKHTAHMDYLWIKSSDDLLLLKSTHWKNIEPTIIKE